ncbi:MAG: NfeD family protein [Dehalococcoidales bacterium]
MKMRLIWAIISIFAEEAAILAVCLLVLPRYNINIHIAVVVLIMVAWLVLSVLLYQAGSRALLKHPVNDPEAIIGKQGVVVQEINPQGLVKIQGELWGANSEEKIDVGEKITVIDCTGIKLTVIRSDSQKNS